MADGWGTATADGRTTAAGVLSVLVFVLTTAAAAWAAKRVGSWAAILLIVFGLAGGLLVATTVSGQDATIALRTCAVLASVPVLVGIFWGITIVLQQLWQGVENVRRAFR